MQRTKQLAKDLIKNYRQTISINPKDFLQAIRGSNKTEICLEIGMGKGGFLNELSQSKPKTLFLGIEVKEERCLHAAKLAAKNQTSLLIFCGNFLQNIDFFNGLQVDQIWFNFPDPWPKKRHHKRRLLNKQSIKTINQILKPKGKIFFKTDSQPLFQDTLQTLKQNQNKICRQIVNYNNQEHPDLPSATTEFERKYRKQGRPIYLIEAAKSYSRPSTGFWSLVDFFFSKSKKA